MNKLMQPIYNLVGRLLFSQQQVWEQKKNAKTMSLTVVFSLVLGLALAKVIHMIYNHQS